MKEVVFKSSNIQCFVAALAAGGASGILPFPALARIQISNPKTWFRYTPNWSIHLRDMMYTLTDRPPAHRIEELRLENLEIDRACAADIRMHSPKLNTVMRDVRVREEDSDDEAEY
ncbi:hypothetical protein NMY22_g16308 [Coprinellus aureogranulatus]|nr:hypothetical protein NMY22_g16308 [Coprinellus aureogranulatus]